MSPHHSKLLNLSFILAVIFPASVGMLGVRSTSNLMDTTSELNHSQRGSGAIIFLLALTAASIVLLGLSFYLLRRAKAQRAADQKAMLKLEEELKNYRAQIESTNKELQAFCYSISHDLRAPIRHIAGFVDLLKKQPTVSQDAKSARHLEFISNAAKQMGALVDGLAFFSSLSNSEMRLELVQLASLVLEVKDCLADTYPGRCIAWRIEENIPDVQADSSMVRQVLVCLLSNSIKFTRPRSEALIEIQYSSTPTEHILVIKDNGVGFNTEYAGKLFGLFQRLHHSDEFEGTGIGLATVRRIISRHGGRTWAEGKVDQGAKFFFTLPRSSVQSSSSNE